MRRWVLFVLDVAENGGAAFLRDLRLFDGVAGALRRELGYP